MHTCKRNLHTGSHTHKYTPAHVWAHIHTQINEQNHRFTHIHSCAHTSLTRRHIYEFCVCLFFSPQFRVYMLLHGWKFRFSEITKDSITRNADNLSLLPFPLSLLGCWVFLCFWFWNISLTLFSVWAHRWTHPSHIQTYKRLNMQELAKSDWCLGSADAMPGHVLSQRSWLQPR